MLVVAAVAEGEAVLALQTVFFQFVQGGFEVVEDDGVGEAFKDES